LEDDTLLAMAASMRNGRNIKTENIKDGSHIYICTSPEHLGETDMAASKLK
jgi:hypothetical protein